MEQRTIGLILRTRPLTETSLIVHWLTRDLGRVTTVAKGARRPKSPFVGKLDLFFEAEFSFVRSRSSELHPLREVSVREFHPRLRMEIGYVQQAAYAAALLEKSTETETPLPEIYDLMRGFVRALPAHPPQPGTVLAFELKLLQELGLQPDAGASKISAGAKQVVERLATGDWQLIARMKLSESQVAEISRFLDGFLIYHLGRIPEIRHAALIAS
ncbi:MAG: DNA repair protein RecO [Verrucomicrobiota bacterium]